MVKKLQQKHIAEDWVKAYAQRLEVLKANNDFGDTPKANIATVVEGLVSILNERTKLINHLQLVCRAYEEGFDMLEVVQQAKELLEGDCDTEI